MAKRTPPYNLLLPAREANTPAYRWLYSALRDDILAGRLRPGSRLPATRDLARQYKLSRGTVLSAFEELKAEGYLHGSKGSGTYVSSVLPEHLLQVTAQRSQERSLGKLHPRPLSIYGLRVQTFPPWICFPSKSGRGWQSVVYATSLSLNCWGATPWGIFRCEPPLPATSTPHAERNASRSR
jgi:GntR family transcriptional regulator / MocR family aminotransferase